MNTPNVSLIHIGMHKTASTYMQSLWSHNSAVSLAQNSLNSIVKEGRDNGWKGARMTPLRTPVKLPLGQLVQPGKKIVLSNENLSGAYFNDDASSEQLHAFREFVAVRMKATIGKSKILIVTRSPEKWIISMYNQTIKTGGTLSFRQFLRKRQDFLRNSCNIRELFNIWKQQYGSDNVLVLPMELLSDDEARFYQLIEQFSGVPACRTTLSDRVNTSLDPLNLEVMRRLNKFANLFLNHGKYHGKPPADIANAQQAVRMDIRYDLQSPTPALAKRLRRLFPNLKPQAISAASIDKGLVKDIRAANAKFFKKDDFFGYKSLYC
jgi:hypothetical protein